VLADLDVPRSTGELSDRHELAPATVSYHLGVLLRAGLVVRQRAGRTVRYHRTERGDGLVG
jgi:DNA-binding transcriptional ArsR family regulator